MSYEYRLVFDDAILAPNVMKSLILSEACVKVQAREVYLKDKELQTPSEYDARLIQEGDQSIWMELNLKSRNLYKLVHSSLSGGGVRCYEDGDLNDEISLKEAFRIKDEK
ncbi:hypothetical protein ACSFA7_23965 [Variovorax sp. LT1R20]|uniref:hypothetical protein n=1 Tax=Variovorax sp. LT1R20 TaxID=3443729 RepID=UPI003F475630